MNHNYVLGITVGVEDTSTNKMDKNTCPHKNLHFGGGGRSKQNN